MGVNKFAFEANPPDTKLIPDDELLGVTVILLTCAYDGREFVRVGYYVNNEYESEELQNDPPAKPIIEKIKRNVLAEKPRVTRFNIKWYVYILQFATEWGRLLIRLEKNRDSEATAPAEFPPEQPEADLVADEEEYGAEELAEEEEAELAEEAAAVGEATGADKDAAMEGVEGENGAVDEEELSDDGSVDIEGESEDDLEEEELDGDAMETDEMEVDKPAVPAAGAPSGAPAPQADAMVH